MPLFSRLIHRLSLDNLKNKRDNRLKTTRSLDIGEPYNVCENFSVKYDAESQSITGLTPELIALLTQNGIHLNLDRNDTSQASHLHNIVRAYKRSIKHQSAYDFDTYFYPV